MGWAGAGFVSTCVESVLGAWWVMPCDVLILLSQRWLVTGVLGKHFWEQWGWSLRAVSALGRVNLKQLMCICDPLEENNIYILSQTSVQFSCSVVSHSLWPHGLQHSRLPCPSPTPRVCSDSCPLSWWRHPTISSLVIPFSSCLQSFPASGSFPMSQFFPSGGHSIGVSATTSVLPTNIQDWFPLGWTGWISLQSKGLSRVFSNTTVQKHQFFSAQLSSQSNSHSHTWPLEKP